MLAQTLSMLRNRAALPGKQFSPFFITGTQTGRPEYLSARDYCIVERYDAERNSVHSYGGG